MAGEVEFHNQTEKRLQAESGTIGSEDLHLQELEARLQGFSDRLPSFHADSEVCLNSGPHIFDPVLDLRVKVDAVRWMLRVAKHMEGPAHERILTTARDSLDQLERAIDQKPHAA